MKKKMPFDLWPTTFDPAVTLDSVSTIVKLEKTKHAWNVVSYDIYVNLVHFLWHFWMIN